MPEKKIIVVFGATGAQGGGVAQAILNDRESEFAVRAVTRDPNSDKAKALAAMGAEIVEADIDDKKMAGIASEDIGKCAYGIFKRGEEMIGKTIGVAGEHLTGSEMAEAMSKVVGKEVIYNNVTPETYRGFGFPGADDIGNMFQFYRDFEEVCNTVRDVKLSRELNGELKSFGEWLAENGQRIPLE